MRPFGDQVALVTGGNRGIGHDVARGLAALGITTYLTSRSADAAAAAAAALADETGGVVVGRRLDVTDWRAAEELVAEVDGRHGRLDILVNNAGIMVDDDRTALEIDLDDVRATLEANLLGPWRLLQLVVPLMRRNGYGRVVNVSSGLGEFPLDPRHRARSAYGTSKLALNAISVLSAAELAGTGILLNVGTPGVCDTDMGDWHVGRTAAEGADVMIWLATLPDDGPHGHVFYERRRVAYVGAKAMNEDAPPYRR